MNNGTVVRDNNNLIREAYILLIGTYWVNLDRAQSHVRLFVKKKLCMFRILRRKGIYYKHTQHLKIMTNNNYKLLRKEEKTKAREKENTLYKDIFIRVIIFRIVYRYEWDRTKELNFEEQYKRKKKENTHRNSGYKSWLECF